MSAPYVLRPMRVDDIPQVLEIDRLSFPTPWSARTYEFEIANRQSSFLVVLEARDSSGGLTSGQGLRQAFRRLWGEAPTEPLLAGYGGCWFIAGEAHISTIAVRPQFRGKKLGELLLVAMLGRALKREAEYSVLEVRVSNAVAQALYRKYEYETVGVRKGYYRDNQEDAYLMEVRPLDEAYRSRFESRLAALRQSVEFDDRFTCAT